MRSEEFRYSDLFWNQCEEYFLQVSETIMGLHELKEIDGSGWREIGLILCRLRTMLVD